MKRTLIILLFMAAGLSLSTSCTDILDKKPLTEVSAEELWNEPDLVSAFVNTRYNFIGHGWPESMESSVCDETELTWLRGCEVSNFARLNPGDLGRMNGGWNGWDNRSWWTEWNNISNCNLFFEQIDAVPFTDENLRTRLKGEVRFIRALEYNDLIIRWGGVPIITKSFNINSIDDIRNQVRASYKDCVDFMVSELDQAAKELPATYSGSEYGRATSVAALALKSRILLYAASDLMNNKVKMPEIGYTTPDPDRWKKAANAADEALQAALSNGYGLYNKENDKSLNYQKLFLDLTSSNNEVLFAKYGTDSKLGQNIEVPDLYNFPNGYGGWGGNCPLSELVDDYEVLKDGKASKFDWNNPEEATNPYANRDPRFYASILYDGAKWKNRDVQIYWDVDNSGKEIGTGGKDSKYGSNNWNASPTGYNLKKFMDESYGGGTWTSGAKMWIWLRVGELYLNKAEAHWHTGDENGAREAVNAIRHRAGMPDITSSGQQLLEDIKHERRIELVFEEHRYFDVRRWQEADKYLGREVHAVTVKRFPDGHKTYTVSPLRSDVGGKRIWEDKMYWLPLMKSEIDKNPNLKQNPGYTN